MVRFKSALRSLRDRIPLLSHDDPRPAEAAPARHPNLLIKKKHFGVKTRQRAADLPRMNADRLAEVAAAAQAEQDCPVLPHLGFMLAPGDPVVAWQREVRQRLDWRRINLDRMDREGYRAGVLASQEAVSALQLAVETPDDPAMRALREGAPLDMLIGSLRREAERLRLEMGLRPGSSNERDAFWSWSPRTGVPLPSGPSEGLATVAAEDRVAPMQVDIEVHDGSLRLPTEPVEFVPDTASGPGWFESSRELRSGMHVIECGAEPPLTPPE